MQSTISPGCSDNPLLVEVELNDMKIGILGG